MSTLAPVRMDKYPAKQHARRVARNMEMPKGLILMKGAQNKLYPDSNDLMPFCQHRAFYYLTGCDEPGCWTTYDVAADKLTLWLPLPQAAKAAWDAETVGPKAVKQEAMDKYDVDEVKFVRVLEKGKAFRTNLRKVIKEHAEKEGSQFAFFKVPMKIVGKPLRKAMREKRKLGLRGALNKSRSRKDEFEVAQIRSAAAVSAEAHADVMKALPGLKSEHEAEAVFLSSCIAQRAKEQAYGATFGAGANGTRLRYTGNTADFESAQTLILDAGAKWNGYTSALARTVPLNPTNPGAWPSAEAEMVYNAVQRIQDESIKLLAPEKKFLHVHWNAIHMAIDALLDMGILKGEHMEIFHAGTAMAFMPHGLGHFVGLDAKDVAPPALFQDAKKGPGAKAGPGAKKGPGAKEDGCMNMKGLEEQDPLSTPLPIHKGPSVKKGSWGKTGPNAAKAVVSEKLGVVEPRPIDEKADFEIIEKPAVETSASEKSDKAGKGKKAAPVRPRDKRFLRTRMVYRNFVAKNNGAFKALNDENVMPAYFSLRPRFCVAPCTPTAPLLKQGNVLAVAPGLYFNKRVINQMLKREKEAQFVDQEVLERFMPVGGVRVKDTVLITEIGYEVLTADAPKGAPMVGLIREAGSA